MTPPATGETLVDTHCHLDSLAVEDGALSLERADAILDRAAAVGVGFCVTIGCGETVERIARAVELARARPTRLRATAGVHPHDARLCDDAFFERVATLAADPLAVAVGEVGLDFHYDHSPRVEQERVFRRFVGLARALRKPIVVHTRSAPERTLAILDEEGARDVGGIIHCFSEGWTFAKAAIDLGFVCSFSGIATFPGARDVREAAARVPDDALLVETDSPYLAPIPLRGKRNEPAYVVHTAACVAELRGQDIAHVRRVTTANARRVLALP
ncbi:MAG: TatD family hydrolase [Deltaproteobacteria bacterium]|nr:TatD family hydrolase [Deltaproteobacteria bacterium]